MVGGILRLLTSRCQIPCLPRIRMQYMAQSPPCWIKIGPVLKLQVETLPLFHHPWEGVAVKGLVIRFLLRVWKKEEEEGKEGKEDCG